MKTPRDIDAMTSTQSGHTLPDTLGISIWLKELAMQQARTNELLCEMKKPTLMSAEGERNLVLNQVSELIQREIRTITTLSANGVMPGTEFKAAHTVLRTLLQMVARMRGEQC